MKGRFIALSKSILKMLILDDLTHSFQTKPRPASGCPEGTIDGLSSCFCEDHCSWEVCRLDEAPNTCLPENFVWVFDTENHLWKSQHSGKFEVSNVLQ